MIYVASSWRNPLQTAVVAALRSADLTTYDFKQPGPGNSGFHWRDVGMPAYQAAYSDVPAHEYLAGIDHPIAVAGFESDFEAMEASDTCVLVLPCGRSAHLELGWFVGQGRETAVLLDDPVTPELMYRMVDFIAPTLGDLLGWLGVQPDLAYAGWERAKDGVA
jgi:hypothetical protein